LRLKAQKPGSVKYPKELKTLGDHIRKRRLDLGLFQRQAAEQIGVDTTTIWNWERHKSSPQVHEIPAALRFLGYNPVPLPKSFPEKVRLVRRVLGLSQKTMARKLGIDPTTIGQWESGRRKDRQVSSWLFFRVSL